MPLAAGARIGAYQIRSLLGAGGMGEVYRATDTRLARDVALKILPEEVGEDAERVGRFEREARLLAALNHSGVATLHGLESVDDRRILTMELVSGETLAQRIARAPIPAAEAVPIFLQIADALEAAHEKGIVHRDLKPANIMLTPEGKTKILDFGLAKAFEGDAGPTDLSRTPTMTHESTRAGMILGTAAYMSPEQARGKGADKRSDIWAFGCCLFEALVGAKPFGGETVTDMLASIVKSDPDWSTLPPSTPPRLRELLRRCLEKDVRERLRDIGDARIELERIAAGKDEPQPQAILAKPARSVSPLLLAAALVAGAAAGILAVRALSRKPPDESPVVRSSIVLPEGQRMPRLWYLPFAMSADGTRLAYVALGKEGTRLYRRGLDSGESVAITGTDGASMPFFSPDGEWIGFFAGGKLKKAPWSGGSPVTLATARIPVGGAWGTDGTIVYAPTQNGGLWRVSAQGGEPSEVTLPDFKDKGYTHCWPQFLDGARSVLFTVWGSSASSANVVDLASRKWSPVATGPAGFTEFVPAGYVLFGDPRKGAGILAARFDPAHPDRIGASAPVIDGARVVYAESARAWTDVSRGGNLLYVRETLDEGKLLWQEASGAGRLLWKRKGPLRSPRLSPDGRSIAFDDTEGNIRILDVERGVDRVLVQSTDPGTAFVVWSPDGQSIAYGSNRGGDWDVWQAPIGAGEPKPMLRRQFDQIPESWVATPNGTLLAYNEINPKTGFDIGVIDGSGKIVDTIVTDANETTPELSPGGRLLAFASDRSGRLEIYLRKLGAPVDTQVSVEGGYEPAWSRDGKRLFFRSGDRVMAVGVTEAPELRLSSPAVVLEAPFDRSPYSEHTYYDVASDGRFLVVEDASATEFTLVSNWGRELRRLVPEK